MIPIPLSADDFPNIDLADIGRRPNFGYGSVAGVRAHCIVGGATAFLAAAVSASATSIIVEDASRFPAAPFTVQVGFERMRVTVKAGTTFTVTRAFDGTTAAEHRISRTVYEARDNYVYLVSKEPVKSIDSLFIDGKKQSEDFTAYTGQAGDEHADWPGFAVVQIDVQAFVEKQRALDQEQASIRETGEDVVAEINEASHDELVDGDTASFVTLSLAGTPLAWAAFALASGAVKKQTYTIQLENAGGSDGSVYAMALDEATKSAAFRKKLTVAAGQSRTFVLEQDQGNWETILNLVPIDEDIRVLEISKTVNRDRVPSADNTSVASGKPAQIVSDDRVADGTVEGVSLLPTALNQAWVSYESTSLGDIVSQTHSAQIVETSGADPVVFDLISSDPDGTGRKITRHTVEASESATVTHTHDRGLWDTLTRVIIITGQMDVLELSKSVNYFNEDILQDKSLEATATSRIVVGDDITVDAEWALDSTGDFGGVGVLIERPEDVIKHFLVDRMEFTLAEIDQASFDAAGVLYAAEIAGGYKFGQVFNKTITPSKELKRLAFEARSTISYDRGSWFLNFIPDAAPAAVRTIDESELAGERALFQFEKGSVTDVINVLTGRFKINYLPSLNEGDWDGTTEISDAASQAKFGDYVDTVDFFSIRDSVMADNVLAHVLLQRKVPLMTVMFPLFFEHFDLQTGDTVDISGGLFAGRKFYIESFARLDEYRATVTALEWWT